MSRQSRPDPVATPWYLRPVVIVLVTTVVITFIGFVLIVRDAQRREEQTPLEARIASLSETLSNAARTVDEAEREIRARQELVQQLQQDQQRYEQLKQLDQEQVDAIAATLQGQLDATEQRARLAQWLLLPSWGALLGVLFAWVAARAVAKRRRSPPQSEDGAGTAPHLEPGP
jgi:flagellar biosynthesis/type III secretory pathway M-ring protein FliF/YscJ